MLDWVSLEPAEEMGLVAALVDFFFRANRAAWRCAKKRPGGNLEFRTFETSTFVCRHAAMRRRERCGSPRRAPVSSVLDPPGVLCGTLACCVERGTSLQYNYDYKRANYFTSTASLKAGCQRDHLFACPFCVINECSPAAIMDG